MSMPEGFWRMIQTRSDQPKMMYVRNGFVLMTIPVFRWRNGKIDSFVISFNARMRNDSKVESLLASRARVEMLLGSVQSLSLRQ